MTSALSLTAPPLASTLPTITIAESLAPSVASAQASSTTLSIRSSGPISSVGSAVEEAVSSTTAVGSNPMTTATSTALPIITADSNPTNLDAAPSPRDDGLGRGAIAGIVIGKFMAITLLILVGGVERNDDRGLHTPRAFAKSFSNNDSVHSATECPPSSIVTGHHEKDMKYQLSGSKQNAPEMEGIHDSVDVDAKESQVGSRVGLAGGK